MVHQTRWGYIIFCMLQVCARKISGTLNKLVIYGTRAQVVSMETDQYRKGREDTANDRTRSISKLLVYLLFSLINITHDHCMQMVPRAFIADGYVQPTTCLTLGIGAPAHLQPCFSGSLACFLWMPLGCLVQRTLCYFCASFCSWRVNLLSSCPER